MAAMQVKSKGTGPHVPKNRCTSDLGPVWRRHCQWSRPIKQENP